MPAISSAMSIVAVVLAADGPARLGDARDYPDIGLRIAMPSTMTGLPPDSLTDWARVGVKGNDGNDGYDQVLVLSAIPGGTHRDAKGLAEDWIRRSGRQRKEYRALAQRSVKWLSSGWEVVSTYRADDKTVTSLQWFGLRAEKPAVIYALTYDVVDGRADAMRTVVQTIARSCKISPIRPASTQPVRLGKRQFLPKQGLSLQVPNTLRMMVPNRKNMLLRAGAVDYSRDRLLPVLTLTTNRARPGDTPQARLEHTVDEMLPSLRPANGEVDSKSPAKMGDLPAYQVVLRMTQRRRRLITAVRLAIRNGRALVLSLTYPAENAKELIGAIEQVSTSLRFEQ